MNHKMTSVMISLVTLIWCTAAYAVKPLTESDLDRVSVETGANILDIFGPAAAGLEDDIAPMTSKQLPIEGKATDQVVSLLLNNKEQESNQAETKIADTNLSFAEIQEAIDAGIQIVGEAKAFDTSSQIKYRESDFSHKADFLANGTVVHTRDLQIDLLKLEDLRGDYTDSKQTFGNIYLSDWHSEGSTRMKVE